MPFSAKLENRCPLLIEGHDSLGFLQNLVSNDLRPVTPTQAVYAALLTPQGKFLHDMFVCGTPDSLWLDVDAGRVDDLIARLTAYRLRAKVAFRAMGDAFDLWAQWGEDVGEAGFADPRLPSFGRRIMMPKNQMPPGVLCDFAAYDEHRISLGVADGARDLEVGQSTLAEGNFDHLNGIDWKKGCYIGQELTARMHYRGLAKKRLFPVRLSAPATFGTPVTDQGREVGSLRSSCGAWGLALLDIAAVRLAVEDKAGFRCDSTEIFPFWPVWMPQKG